MITHHHRTTHKITLILLTLMSTVIVMLAGTAGVAQATVQPVKLVLSSHITNGFEYSEGVAVDNYSASPEYGDVFVVDKGNRRVQVLSPTGVFVEMFGEEVDATTKGNVCTAASRNTCQAGVEGTGPGQFSEASSIAVDPSSGNVYVAEYVFTEVGFGLRVQEFTADGQFVLEIGKEVNMTNDKEPSATDAEKNLCSELEIEKGGECGPPAQEVPGSVEDGAFNFEAQDAELLAVGGTGTKDLLYVGDERRVQEFEAAGGKWVGEIPLTSISAERDSKVQALAFDQESGNVYLVYPRDDLIREFDPEENTELESITVNPKHEGREVYVRGVALDSSGRLAVTANESGGELLGSLYAATNGRRITGFAIPAGSVLFGIGFGDTGELYASLESGEILKYEPYPIAELTIGSNVCEPGPERENSATFDCTLNGETNPEGVSETEALFEWGRTPDLGEKTPALPIAATEPVHATVNLRPNETYYYQLAGFDHNVKPPEEAFSSEQASLATPTVAPHIGAPSVIAARPSSAVLFSELNPENASTEYYFEYAQSEHALTACTTVVKEHGSCPDVQSTTLQKSAVYGSIGAKAEITGLQPGTTYHYRLFAEDESRINHGEHLKTIGPEVSFTTEPTPLPSAQTGAYSTVTSTSATITGAVNPDGVPAGYAFELGVYNGTNTQYTIVYSAEAGSGNTPIEESLPVTGLQPGTAYAYRIAVSSGYIANEAHALQGAPVTFTTAGTSSVLVLPVTPALLPVPAIAFPAEAPGATTTVTKTLTRAQKLAAALKACKKDKSKSKRAKCEKAARKTYGPTKKGKKG